MFDLGTFLNARLDEDERDIDQIEAYGGCCSGCHCGCADLDRARRDIEAKRSIVDACASPLSLLAAVYFDHPDHPDCPAAVGTVTS